MGREVIVLTGKRFGRWVAHERVFDRPGTRWRCVCDCGGVGVVDSNSLRNGLSKSCGCYKQERAIETNTTHGMSGTPELLAWKCVQNRCNDLSDPLYGGRGIEVSVRWLGPNGFANFLADVGYRPSPRHSIDRYPDNDGNYEPGNVRWATPAEQNRNKRNNIKITYGGISQTLADWADALGIKRCTVYQRYHKGWPVEKILSTDLYVRFTTGN